jgi:hypothetical protein
MLVCCECCVFSGSGLCDVLITRAEESYRLWYIVMYDLETSWMRRLWPTGGCRTKNKQTIHYKFKPSSPTNHFFSQVNCRSKMINAAERKTRRGFSFFTCRMKLLWEKVRHIVTWEWLNLNNVSTVTLSVIFEEVDEDASIHQVFQPQCCMKWRDFSVSHSFYKI